MFEPRASLRRAVAIHVPAVHAKVVKVFVEAAFEHVGLDWQEHVVVDPKFFRPAEVNILLGDGTKAKEKLGWEPETSFEEMVQMMVDRDLEVVAEKGA